MSQFTSLHTVAACLTIPSPLSRADVKRCWTKGSEITDAVLHISLSVTFTLFLCLLVAYGIPAHCSLCCLYAPPRTKLCPGPCCVLSSLCQGQLLRQLYKYLLKLPDNMGGGFTASRLLESDSARDGWTSVSGGVHHPSCCPNTFCRDGGGRDR